MNVLPQLRTLIALSRVWKLPTIWSNCLAGWWLGGGGNYWKLPFLFLGVSLLYTGGMFLNDAFDAEFDRERHPEHPIPSGRISAQQVWRCGFGQLVAGIFLLLFCSQISAGAAIFLALFIVLYNFSHLFFTAAPWLMGACRFWIYIIAGAAGAGGLNGWAIFCGAALTLYTVGASDIMRRENSRAAIPYWPVCLLAAPVVLAMTMNTGHYRLRALGMVALIALWSVRYLRMIFRSGTINRERIQSGLLAGIVLVDGLAVAPQCSLWLGFLMAFLFGATVLLQKQFLAR